jgi:hypothetical protein
VTRGGAARGGARRLASVLLVAVAGTARGDPPLALPDGPGRLQVERACSQCHALETVIRQHRTRAQWEAKIDSMIAKGAKVSDEEFELIAAYLAEHFGSGTGG